MKLIHIFLVVAVFLLLSQAAYAASPTITSGMIKSISAQDPTPASTTAVEIWFVANDADGAGNLDNSTAAAHFSKAAEATRSDTTCSAASYNATAINYTCSVDMQFYDGPGVWTINVTVDDAESNTATNTDTNFTYNSGTHMTMTPTAVNFGSLNVGATDKNASDDPIVITNSGNVDIATVNITAYDLVGEAASSYTIGAAQFEANAADAAGGDTLSNGAAVTVAGVTIAHGPAVSDNVYFYVDVPSTDIQVQSYSTAGGTDWTVAVFA